MKDRMSSTSTDFELDSLSDNYLKYRPTYPAELYERILKYVDEDSNGVKRRGLAVDIGCGSGQNTQHLAKSFDTVIGVDNSEAQLKKARIACSNYKNITFRMGSAENLSEMFDEGSVDLVTAATALHWFDFEKVFSECLKILKVGGTFAAYGLFYPVFDNAEASDVVHKVFTGPFEQYYSTVPLYHVYNEYQEIHAALTNYFRQCIRDDSIINRVEYSLDELMGYFKSHPPYYRYKADHPEQSDIFSAAIEKLQSIYGTNSMEEKVAKASYSIPFLMGKKSNETRYIE